MAITLVSYKSSTLAQQMTRPGFSKMDYVFLSLIILIPVTIAVAIAYFLTKLAAMLAGWLFRNSDYQKRWKLGARFLAAAAILGFATYSTYDAVYPADDFFLGELEKVTFQRAPTSAEVMSSSASFPDFHGDYCSFSRIKLAKADFQNLLDVIAGNSNFNEGLIIGSSSENEVIASQPHMSTLKEYVRPDPGRTDHYFGIRFLDSREHIEVSVCIT